MIALSHNVDDHHNLEGEIQRVLTKLGVGKITGVAYDTAWVARLSQAYPQYGFEQSVDWLRDNQAPDGSWGASTVHYHDRFISTLAAIIALREVGDQPGDLQRVKRGESVLWKLVGHLGKDNSDTIGFPVLSSALAEEATALGLEVPHPPVRYATAYKAKVALLLNQTQRNWRKNTLSFSLEAMRSSVRADDDILESNYSINVSPSATAGYLLQHRDERSLGYLQRVLAREATGAAPAVAPIDIFEITWALNHLRLADAIQPDDPSVRTALEYLWKIWSPENGVSYSSYFTVANLDDTASCFTVLHWGGYPVDMKVFERFEREDHFYCFPNETDISLGAHVRLLMALKQWGDLETYRPWVDKIMRVFNQFDHNGTFWWDKWHVSPYYVSSTAVIAMEGLANDLARTRLKWILRTQNRDGGWGYLENSTPEETAYCVEALLYWDRNVEPINPDVLDMADRFLRRHIHDKAFTPLWIGKSLYTPQYPVKAAILGAVFTYINQGAK